MADESQIRSWAKELGFTVKKKFSEADRKGDENEDVLHVGCDKPVDPGSDTSCERVGIAND